MTDTELRDELMTLLTAGHETTATGLAWAFERLLRTPRVLERLTASLDDDDYLDAVVKETLRVRPVDRRRGAQAHARDRGGGLAAARRDARAAGDRGAARPPGPVRLARGVPAGALPGRRDRVVRLDPVRRRGAALHRRVVRPGRDADGAARGAAARAPARALAAARARRDPARDRGAGARRPRRRRGAPSRRACGGTRRRPQRPPRRSRTRRARSASEVTTDSIRRARRRSRPARRCRRRPRSARGATRSARPRVVALEVERACRRRRP